ncbi:MAG: rod shape-determining protein MreC, partial [Bdellovibrionaceae bacterium]|nr:rod shape-determining protein MreC [Pseudobdellovibrionaceae bacterium]
MNFLNFNFRKLVLFVLLISLPIISVNMEQKKTDRWVTDPFRVLSGYSQEIFFLFSSEVQKTTRHYLDLINIKKENRLLRSENAQLKAQLNLFEELRLENARLQKLLGLRESTKMELVAAQVIGRDLVPDHSTLTINKGTSDGLKAGMAVITTEGAVGYIFRPSTETSHVLLLDDRFSVADGILQRTRSAGLLEGAAKGRGIFKYMEKADDVVPGDLVVTGGLDSIYPKGLPLAVVESIETKSFTVAP